MSPMPPIIRLATPRDVPAMHAIRLDVHENRLSSPARVTEQDYYQYIAASSAWVAEMDGRVVGFAAANKDSIWALFVSPSTEKRGIGRLLHTRLIVWAKTLGLDRLTLTTAAGTRAEGFYRRLGWCSPDTEPDGSMRFTWRME